MGPRTAELARIAQRLGASADPAGVLTEMVSAARQLLGCDAVGVFLRERRGTVRVVPCSAASARVADELQLAYQEGPCLQAVAGAEVVLTPDVGSDTRWPRFGSKVAGLGWLSILSTPLATDDRLLGSINCYSRRPAAFDDRHAELAAIFASHAAVAYTAAVEIAGLRQAVSARHHIGQAQGILMAQHRVDADAAFELLRRYSQTHNVKLRSVADHVIATGQMPGAPTAQARVLEGRDGRTAAYSTARPKDADSPDASTFLSAVTLPSAR